MASLSILNKNKLEKLFDMKGGYVLDFSNSSFQRHIKDVVNIDIYDDKYLDNGDSKANRLRTFWDKESNKVVARLLNSLLEYYKYIYMSDNKEIRERINLFNECEKIIEELEENTQEIMVNLDTISDDNFEVLSSAIRECIDRGQAILAVDRLHTYMVRYIRKLCDLNSIEYNKSEPLNSCYGKYTKYLINNGIIESDMTKTILRNWISIMDKFNDVRNNKSFAHDNEVLNNNESILICKNIISIIDFINNIERINKK